MKQASQNLRLAFAFVLAAVGVLLNATPAHALDQPRLRLQTWVTRSSINWVRALGPDRWAVSYFNGGGAGLDVLDRTGALLQRSWPLPEGSVAAAVNPDGTPLVRNSGEGWEGAYPAILPGGRVVRVSDPGWLEVFDPGDTSGGRLYALHIWHPSSRSRVVGCEAQSDGLLLVWGELAFPDGSWANLCRIKVDETLDLAFRPVVSGSIRNLRIAADGSILVHAQDEDLSGAGTEQWLRLNADGTLRSLRQIDFPEGARPFASTLTDDGSVILSVDGGTILRTISPGGASTDRAGLDLPSDWWPVFGPVSDLVALAGGAAAAVQRRPCDGPVCSAGDWLTLLPGDGNPASPVLWMPPVPAAAGAPLLLIDHLSSEATYVVQASTDLSQWRDLETQPNRSADRMRMYVQDFEAGSLNLNRRFYRIVRKND